MSDLTPYIMIGITTGSIYALAAVGLVLTFKTSGIFNFAHGAQAAVAAYVFFEFYERNNIAWPLAGLLTLVLVGVGGGLILERLAAGLAGAPLTARVAATIGLLVGTQGILEKIFGGEALIVDFFLPTKPIDLPGFVIREDQIIVTVLALGGTLGLYWFLKTRRLGIAMQARHRGPRPAGRQGDQPRPGAALGLDHRVDLRHRVRHPAGPHHQPQRLGADAAGLLRLRGRGARHVRQPRADPRRWARHRRRRRRPHEVHHRRRGAGRSPVLAAVHRPVRRPGLRPQGEAPGAGIGAAAPSAPGPDGHPPGRSALRRRAGAGRSRRRPPCRGFGPGVALRQRPRLRRDLRLAVPPGPGLGADLVVPDDVRRYRRRGVRPRHGGRLAVGSGRPGRRAGCASGGHRRRPAGLPPVGPLPGHGHVRLRSAGARRPLLHAVDVRRAPRLRARRAAAQAGRPPPRHRRRLLLRGPRHRRGRRPPGLRREPGTARAAAPGHGRCPGWR